MVGSGWGGGGGGGGKQKEVIGKLLKLKSGRRLLELPGASWGAPGAFKGFVVYFRLSWGIPRASRFWRFVEFLVPSPASGASLHQESGVWNNFLILSSKSV